MAKSIWKPGERMSRLEKKQLREKMPHPNRGRRLYQWRVENRRMMKLLEPIFVDIREVDWTAIANRPELFEPAPCSSL